jgi:hypothetical protein
MVGVLPFAYTRTKLEFFLEEKGLAPVPLKKPQVYIKRFPSHSEDYSFATSEN